MKVETETVKFGRPFEMKGGKRVNVYLDAESLRTAAKLGDGNISLGIRVALSLKKEKNKIEALQACDS